MPPFVLAYRNRRTTEWKEADSSLYRETALVRRGIKSIALRNVYRKYNKAAGRPPCWKLQTAVWKVLYFLAFFLFPKLVSTDPPI